MKILITGMNKLQTVENHHENQQLKVVVAHYSLLHGLRDAGHEVVMKKVEFGEELDDYDKVIVFLHSPTGFGCFPYEALYALWKRPDALLAFDDWQVKGILNSILDLQFDLFRRYEGTEAYDWDEQCQSALSSIRRGDRTIMVPTYPDGDLTLLAPMWKGRWARWCPDPYHQHIRHSWTEIQKIRKWNFVSLVQSKTSRWLRDYDCLDWHIDKFGSRKDGQPRMEESDLIKTVYSTYWGSLLPGYYHSGSGWWRCRIRQVLDHGGILAGDEDELDVIVGSHYSAAAVEQFNDSQLKDYAQSQYENFSSRVSLRKDDFHKEVVLCLASTN